MNFEELRKKYLKFLYNSYNIFEEDNKICIEYDFEIENLTKFKPRIEILKKEFVFKDISEPLIIAEQLFSNSEALSLIQNPNYDSIGVGLALVHDHYYWSIYLANLT